MDLRGTRLDRGSGTSWYGKGDEDLNESWGKEDGEDGTDFENF
jgi:hypothetical protein